MVSGESRVSHYRLLAKLGQGSMGAVYRAEDVRLHRQVALKILRGFSPENTADRERILEEARAIAALEHPHITLLYEYDEYEGGPFLAMQLVEGETLKATIARGPLPEARTREILRAVASALEEAHARGILHRDVKSENILLGEDGSIKLADFGVARFAEAAAATQTGGAGTPAYMAPERIEGERASEASDQFALGIVAYETLTGGRPFLGETVSAVFYQILHQDPPPASSRRPGIHPAWDAFLAKALARDPKERFANMLEFARALPEVDVPVPRKGGIL